MAPSESRPPSILERSLRVFSEVRPGEGSTGLILLFNIFLVLAAYYMVKPVREGWLSITVVQGLSKMEVKAYSSFAQSMALLFVIPLYARLANRMSRRGLITVVTLFLQSNLVIFWLVQPGLLAQRIPYAGIVFYLWVGIFGVLVVMQFWAFAADLYTDEQGKRLFPLIAVGATAGAVFGSWLTERFIMTGTRETFDLILFAIVPLSVALVLTWAADRRGAAALAGQNPLEKKKPPAAPDRTGAFRLVFRTRYLLAIALLSLLFSWVNSNGENVLYRMVQDTVEAECQKSGITDTGAVGRFVKDRTTAFYGNLYLWVNITALLIQALLVSRFLKYGGVVTILMMTPLVSFLSYFLMALMPALLVVRVMKIAENATNYSVNNTARHVLWLPLTPSMIYKGKAATDTLFVRIGDGLAALTVMAGMQFLLLPTKAFLLFNVFLTLIWVVIAARVSQQNRKLVKEMSGDNEPA